MQPLYEIVNNIYPLPDDAHLAIHDIVCETYLPRGYQLMHAGKTERSLFFIKKGIVRAYAPNDHNGTTFWFGQEGDIILSMRSFVNNIPGYESIELIENCTLYEVRSESLQALFNTNIHIANRGRKLAERELIKAEERLIVHQFKTAMERYKELMDYKPDLLLRVPLRHIASYLGITQVSLSRIRAELK